MADSARTSRLDPSSLFGPEERLTLHQLRLLELWKASTERKKLADGAEAELSSEVAAIPSTWNLTKGVKPHPWQEDCILKWRKKKGHGTVKVVTGGGKTMLALFIAQLLQNTEDPELRVVIVVPTIVLLHQWYQTIVEHGNVPGAAIGRLGGGYEDDFQGRRILIAVLASASQRLPKLVKDANVQDHLLLIADECHRAGAEEMSNVFKTKCRWSLGLSATPEREEDVDSGYDKSYLGRKIGPIIYQFTLADALRHELVPKFTIHHLGLSMTADERQRYDALSRSITDSLSQLKGLRDPGSEGDFFSWARSVALRNQGEMGAIARRFVFDTSKRRELLNHLDARYHAVIQLITQEFAVNPEARVILFHESIEDVWDLFGILWKNGFKAIAEHSVLPGSTREEGLELFRQGSARIIVSARSLIEGFNVPAVDVGIIVASSGSVRQRIQSLGRVLRRHRGRNGEEKTPRIFVLYAVNSSEEQIYGKLNWDETTGADCNKYFLWTDIEGDPAPQAGPPRTPLPTESQVDVAALAEGCKYPGQYEGAELSCDSQQNISDGDGRYAQETADLAEAILRVKGGAGKFRITPKQRLALVRVPVGDQWETLFVMRLKKPLRFGAPSRGGDSPEEAAAWAVSAHPGDAYPFAALPLVADGLRYKQKAGGAISKKFRGGEALARCGDKATDARKGADAARLIAAIKSLQKAGRRISRIELNEARHVTYREAGQLFFICGLEDGLEFPQIQQD